MRVVSCKCLYLLLAENADAFRDLAGCGRGGRKKAAGGCVPRRCERRVLAVTDSAAPPAVPARCAAASAATASSLCTPAALSASTCACAICGVLIISLPIPIITENFEKFYMEQHKKEKDAKRKHKLRFAKKEEEKRERIR